MANVQFIEPNQGKRKYTGHLQTVLCLGLEKKISFFFIHGQLKNIESMPPIS